MAAKLVLAAFGALMLPGNAEPVCNVTGYYFTPDMFYKTGDIKTLELDAEECQRRCRDTINCEYYSFWPDNGCHLHDENATLTKGTCPESVANCSSPYAVTGLKNCSDITVNLMDLLVVEEKTESGGFPVWAGILIALAVAGILLAVVYFYKDLFLGKGAKKSKKTRAAKVEAPEAAPDAEPLVAAPAVLAPVPVMQAVPVPMYAVQPTYVVAPQYAAQAQQVVYIQQEPVAPQP